MIHLLIKRKIMRKRLNKITTYNKVFIKYTLIMVISPRKSGSNHQRLILMDNTVKCTI